ncbi:DNA methyltransferase [Halorussus salinus]|uniref:DNA methyltransferase n=1 Tax=Halorussus salinus TaxID=1364935 RepID=UPI001092CD29|nr:DNA methyltransferase [Halorussus salinus]
MTNWDRDDESSGEQPHMRVYDDRVVIVDENGDKIEYKEGTQTEAARQRYQHIRSELEDGFLRDLIQKVTNVDSALDLDTEEMDSTHVALLDEVVDAITSERGRAVAGLLVGQLTIKSIAPEQSIRLHKGSKSSAHFGWEEGLSMRSIDSDFIAPALRANDLLRVNKDGVMMTRSLAENYPYSQFYKANIRGAQAEWGKIVEAVEQEGGLDAENALKYLLLGLTNRGERAQEIHEQTLENVAELTERNPSAETVQSIINSHISSSRHAARIYEIALHSLYQVLANNGLLDGELKQLTQMRSADKKHGNIADIEVVSPDNEFHIKRAWDAKYGKTHLLQELKEIRGKLNSHQEAEIVGFITSSEPELDSRIQEQISKVEAEFDVDVEIVSFDTFCRERLNKLNNRMVPPSDWLEAYAETICQQRRDQAPIDEPTQEWASELGELVTQHRL